MNQDKENKIFVESPKKLFNEFEVVNDIQEAVKRLKIGQAIARFEYGDSMQPILGNGEYGIVRPIGNKTIEAGDTVLCEVNGILMTHMVIMVANNKYVPYYLIGMANLECYGWIKQENIFGIVQPTGIFEKPLMI